MDKAVVGFAVIFVVVAIFFALVSSCSPQSMTKNWGGSMTIELEPGQKLEEITWKDDSLWILTRPMTEEDMAETHTFYESDTLGILEGSMTIIERLP